MLKIDNILVAVLIKGAEKWFRQMKTGKGIMILQALFFFISVPLTFLVSDECSVGNQKSSRGVREIIWRPSDGQWAYQNWRREFINASSRYLSGINARGVISNWIADIRLVCYNALISWQH